MSDIELKHYGIIRRSGRYPWGSGGQTSPSPGAFLRAVDKLSGSGMSEVEVANALGLSTLELRNEKTIAKGYVKEAQRLSVTRFKESGMSISAITERTGWAESTVRSLLRPAANAKFRVIQTIANVLKSAVAKFGFIDVGESVETYLGTSETKLRNAVALLQKEGYTIHYLRQQQLGTQHQTSIKVLAAPGVEYKDVIANKDKIQIPNAYSVDKGHSFTERVPINNVDSSRVMVVTAENGGADKDGLIELRRTPDLDMGPKRFVQARIGIDGTHYLKGMAVHPPDNQMPDGVDIVFYTSKPAGLADQKDYMKPQVAEGASPFGSSFKQKQTLDPEGNPIVSAVNVLYEEGDWSTWDKNLASQFLAKQSPRLAEQQLETLYQNQVDYLEDIKSIPNETVRQHLSLHAAEGIDRQAVHLQAAAMPRQSTAVLIPDTSIPENQIYAPNYRDGEQVVLVRYPHGGIFEIPQLTVNNNNPEMRRVLGSDAADAVAINPKTAAKLSGADFDGDTVIVMPNNEGRIVTAPSLEGLKNFDPKLAYPPVEGMRPMTSRQTGLKMGDVSNLITDMTVQGASQAELARAVRHSMVVIDAEKHKLNWRQSHIDNGIAALKTKYQGGPTSGASTLLSKATSPERVPHRKPGVRIDKSTGEKIFTETGETYTNKQGKVVARTTVSKALAETKDAYNLSSGTVIESVYADHSNKLKSLANETRKQAVNLKPKGRDPVAAKNYAPEVASLDKKLLAVSKHQPLERKAQLVGDTLYQEKAAANPGWTAAQKSKEKDRALGMARAKVGLEVQGKILKKPSIQITQREWEAINMNAISPTKLKVILNHADPDILRTMALPSKTKPLPPNKVKRAQVLLNAGYTPSEVADAIGGSIGQIEGLRDNT